MEQQNLSFPILFSSLLFLFILIKVSKKLFRNGSNPPPGPWKLPFLGNLHQLAGDTPHRRLKELAKTYGPVMGLKLGQVPFLIISSPEAAKEVLKTQDPIFAERPLVLAAETVTYNGNDIIFGSYGDQWRQMRKICTLELLSLKRVQSFQSVREEEVAEFIKLLGSREGSSVNLTRALFALTNSIIARNAVGHKSKNQKMLLHVIDDVLVSGGGVGVVDIFPSLKWLPTVKRENDRIWGLHHKTDEILEDILKEHRANRHVERKKADNLLDVLLDLQESGNLDVPLTDEAIKAVIIDMFVAGSDTSAKTIEWAMAELIKHPEEMKKAQKEIRSFFDEKGYVDEAKLQEMQCLKLITKETLRLHPAATVISRVCREKTKIQGYDIFPDTRVFVNIWAIGRDPEVWFEAEKFKPERFIDNQIDYRGTNFELIPFGAGKRICPGMILGTVNLELILANLLFYFDWKFPGGVTADNLDMDEVFGVVVKRKVDLELVPSKHYP